MVFDDFVLAMFYTARNLLGGAAVTFILAAGVWDVSVFLLRAYAEVRSRMVNQLKEALNK